LKGQKEEKQEKKLRVSIWDTIKREQKEDQTHITVIVEEEADVARIQGLTREGDHVIEGLVLEEDLVPTLVTVIEEDLDQDQEKEDIDFFLVFFFEINYIYLCDFFFLIFFYFFSFFLVL